MYTIVDPGCGRGTPAVSAAGNTREGIHKLARGSWQTTWTTLSAGVCSPYYCCCTFPNIVSLNNPLPSHLLCRVCSTQRKKNKSIAPDHALVCLLHPMYADTDPFSISSGARIRKKSSLYPSPCADDLEKQHLRDPCHPASTLKHLSIRRSKLVSTLP